jgi:asparagine synthase (glutamine-hydrolysing)
MQNISLRVLGYCDAGPERITEIIDSGRIDKLTDLGGEYTLIYKTAFETGIVTSRIGAIQYFYYYDGIKFVHGEHISEIIGLANIPWEWNWESVGDLCDLENLTENRTLHLRIRRVPPSSILRFNDKLVIRTLPLLDELKIGSSDPVDAVDILNFETQRWITSNPYLSLSGGFDSRVILSSMLKQSIYPTLVTLGNNSSSDIQVATKIAETFQLKQIKVELDLNDFLENAEHISHITNGTKPACHWHTFLYPQKALVPSDQSFFVGTLGEFARSYYFDRGFVSLLAEGFPRALQERFWMMKLSRHRTFRDGELNHLCDPLRLQLNVSGVAIRAKRNARLSAGEFLSGGTRYYLEQRVPNFYANGIRMYNDTSCWRSPFHNLKWLEIIWSLNDNWKLGSNWHRLAIQRNYPRLLSFPEEKGFNKKRMLSRAPALYWLPPMQRMKYQTYDLSKYWYTDNRIGEFVLDNHIYVDELIDKQLTEKIIREHRSNATRTKAISFILTVLYFKMALARSS